MKKVAVQTDYRGVLFILPAMLVLCLATVYPYLYAIFISFQKLSYGAIKGFVFLDNYIRVLRDSSFQNAGVHQLLIVVVSCIFQFLLGMFGALALNRTTKLSYVFRSMILVPWVLPGVVCGLLWQWIFNGNVGVLNYVLFDVGLIPKYIPWLSSAMYSKIAILVVNIWRVFPFMMVMYLSGLQSIPGEQYEAALIDGANEWQSLVYVTLPNMRSIIAMTLILSSIWNFKIFDIIWTLTGGGPNGATEVFSTLIYKYSFQRADFGYSSAVAVIMAIIISIPVFINLKMNEKKEI